MSMNAGQKTVDWLFREQLQVNREWSVERPTGFTWWADRHAQTVEVIGSETDERGEAAYLISIRTDFLQILDLTDKALTLINAVLMPFASMAGPVYDEATRSLKFCSLVRIHEAIREWMSPLISMAAVLQIAEARIMAEKIAGFLGAESAESGHPTNGKRPVPDELAEIVDSLIAPEGRKPCQWSQNEFELAVKNHMRRPPCLRATHGKLGFTAEFPFGNESSLFRATGVEPHPRYGNGLFLIQAFRAGDLAEQQGIRLALSLNATELTTRPEGYGFGSYCYKDGCIHFTTFLPNAVYRKGLLPNFYHAAASRALRLSTLLRNADGDGGAELTHDGQTILNDDLRKAIRREVNSPDCHPNVEEQNKGEPSARGIVSKRTPTPAAMTVPRKSRKDVPPSNASANPTPVTSTAPAAGTTPKTRMPATAVTGAYFAVRECVTPSKRKKR